MPIFEYQCGNCGHEFELIRLASEKDRDVACPRCGRKKAKKLMSLFGGGKSACGTCASSSSCSSHT